MTMSIGSAVLVTTSNFIKHFEMKIVNIVWSQFVLISVVIIFSIYREDISKKLFKQDAIIGNQTQSKDSKILKYWDVCLHNWNKNGNLRTVKRVFERLGYEAADGSKGDDWDILWSMEYPYQDNYPEVFNAMFQPLKPHQKINHYPGTSFITNKVYLTTHNRDLDFILPSFELPRMEKDFQEYIKLNPNKRLVTKHMYNRGVKIVNQTDVQNQKKFKFLQEFMEDPLLIDDHFFDIGVYVLTTSVDPLRVYRYDRDIIIRFCNQPYYPFDPNIIGKYVVDGTHLPDAELPSFKRFLDDYGFPSKAAFEAILKEKNYDVNQFWENIDDAITTLMLRNENRVIAELKRYNFTFHRNNFELVRFDFVLDKNFKLYLMEVNQSPNLTPTYQLFKDNSLIREQLVYETLVLVGAGSYFDMMSCYDKHSEEMTSNSRNIAVNIKTCENNNCRSNFGLKECELCLTYLSEENILYMHQASREHYRRGGFTRLLPSKRYNEKFLNSTKISENNKISFNWFKMKCKEDVSWC
ncbi:CLUMA_CG005386, isoform A [Clunio marinus]|uniref:CLUMA_CG005386, isoform A n=1 Tax=Clunio marinus TaxID=568069 RepID=A0A1J1HUK4_9DIPT|nr:CLUMA_CG005386, isoform A [Clunio marinus]